MEPNPVIDSMYATLSEAIEGTKAPKEVRDSLALIEVMYLSFDGYVHTGQIVMHKDVKSDIQDIFSELLSIHFPIEKVRPIVAYDWDDERSMCDNNSSGFNYRSILDTDQISNHSFGQALDLNPALNPYIKNGTSYPSGATHDPSRPGTICEDSAVVRIFEDRGWKWGSEYTDRKDFQHFAKRLSF